MKHPQHIVSVEKAVFNFQRPSSDLSGLFHFAHMDEFLRASDGAITISRREELEKHPKYGQLLPYIVLWQRHKPTGKIAIFVYRRGKGVGESRLVGNHSIGIGGHVDLADVVHTSSVVDLRATIERSVIREMTEEVLFDHYRGSTYTFQHLDLNHVMPKFVGIITDNTNDVGKVHLGLLFTYEVPDGYTPRCREEELETVGMVEDAHFEGASMENWSEIVIDQFEKIKESL
jgi:predicted NUDIX family phosphoesterase